MADETDDSGWTGSCVRCGSSDHWGVTLYDDHAGLHGSFGEGIDLCDDCREKFEQWLNSA